MSFRRLHPEQPESFEFTPENLAWAKERIAMYPKGREASAVIPLLWRAQEQEGWTTEPMIRYVAGMLGMQPVRVLEIATFYTMFQLSPVGGKAHIQVCGTTPCQLRGAEELIKVCKRKIASKAHELSGDGDFSWEEVECLGACANAPMIQIGEKVYEDLTAERLEEIIDEIAAGREPREGPQNGRKSSEPLGGATTLSDESLYERGSDAEKLIAAAMKKGKGARKAAAGKAAAGKAATGKAAAGKAADEKPVSGKAAAKKKPATRKAAAGKGRSAAAGGGEGQALMAVTPGAGEVEAARAKKPLLHKSAPKRTDDLKMIAGIGPKLEKLLNEMGVYTFRQIAGWGAAEIKWVDERLKFKGRIVRDDWVAQADALASGGRDEYVKRFGKEPR